MAFSAGQLGHVAEHNRLLGAPLGTLTSGYAQVTANQASITTVVDVTGLTVTVTVGASRRIRITGRAWFSSSVSNDVVLFAIQESTTVLSAAQMILAGAAGTLQSAHAEVILTPSAGAHTYKLTAQRAAGTGSITMSAGATFPAFIIAEDIGL